ncbi:MAG: hypothetical protein A2X55_07835 [Nitrospirae bacterium GWB2_47_37]|nr:MAG: hypothetical protein A2X55_07835 [Nitrospirae bacterium GWB2_47_37]
MSELEELQKTIVELREKLEKIPAYDSAKIDALFNRIQAIEDKIAGSQMKQVPEKKKGRPRKEKAEESKAEQPKEKKQIDFIMEEDKPWWESL